MQNRTNREIGQLGEAMARKPIAIQSDNKGSWPKALKYRSGNREIGQLGEAMARKYLLKKGCRILDMNFITPFGEIDLVVKKNSFTIFVEVKTRTSRKFGSPLYAITAAKQKSIISNSLFYLQKGGLCDTHARIDIIAIDLDKNRKLKILEHVKNVIEL